jgi:hypothetical protein
MANVPRNHHFLPQAAHLNHFVEAEGLYVYDRQEGVVRGPLTPKRVAVRKDYYSLLGKEGPLESSLEQPGLSTADGVASGIVKKLIGKQPITLDERLAFSLFSA